MKNNVLLVLEFFKNNFKTIFIGLFCLFILYWVIFFMTPKAQLSESSKKELEKLNEHIENIEEEQQVLQNQIDDYKVKVEETNQNIQNIKNIKIETANEYGEKINSAGKFGHPELSRFFADRYAKYYN